MGVCRGSALGGVLLFSALFMLSSSPCKATDEEDLEFSLESVQRSRFQKVLSEPWLGAKQSPVKSECEVQSLQRILNSRWQTWQARTDQTRKFLIECESEYTDREVGPIGAMMGDYLSEYDFTDNPNIKPFNLLLQGLSRKVYVGLQPTQDKRPLILVQCGMLCNSNTQAFSVATMALYDESPFHVLLVPSISGPEFQRENHVTLFGGAVEGLLLKELSHWVRSSECPFRDRVSSIHVFGFSLGANAALFASAIESNDRANGHAPEIESVIAACPVVNLEDSVHSLFSGSTVADIFASAVKRRLKSVRDSVPLLNLLLGTEETELENSRLPNLIGQAGFLELQKSPLQQLLQDKLGTSAVHSLDEFWQINDFNRFVEGVKIPTLLIGSNDDPVVNSALNFHPLKKKVSQQSTSSPVSFLEVERGGHCSFSRAYGWRPVVSLYRDYIQATTSAPVHFTHQKIPLSGYSGMSSPFSPTDGYRLADIQFSLTRHQDQARVIATYKRPEAGTKGGGLATYKTPIGKISLSSFGQMKVGVPRTNSEAQALSRRVNALARLRFQGRFGDFQSPVSLEIDTPTPLE